MSNIFNKTGGAKTNRSAFNLSYEKKFTCDMGQLIPVMCDEVVPGDIFNISNDIVLRMNPLIAPVLHEVNVFIHSFFVPYRLLWDEWEDFITGGVDGDLAPSLPYWRPQPDENQLNSLWDYLGFPVAVDPGNTSSPLDFPRRAYNFIYNNYYRDENLIDEVDLDNTDILKRAWEKDYFTSALPWQQRGVAPALPISGTTSAVWASDLTLNWPDVEDDGTSNGMFINVPGNAPFNANTKNALEQGFIYESDINNNTVNLGSAITFSVADLRLAFQIQKWLERNARAGARYTEFLRSHFGVSPRDERLDRPEYIGGSRSPIIVSEVLQTSATDETTPQGNLAGHGIGVDSKFIGKYRVTEFGLIMNLMSIMPKPAYSQGIDRQWLRRTKYDYYFPEFANLSEQAITNAELYCKNIQDGTNEGIFGYQGRYDEMRVKRNMVCGELRSQGNLNYWTMSREFADTPVLNQSFIECDPTKRIFAVESEPSCIVAIGNNIRAIRPLPIMSNPGLIDH